MSNIYYVYIYLDPRKSGNFNYNELHFDYEPLYVGCGKDNRYLKHLSENKKYTTNKFKFNKINHIKELNLLPIIIKLYENLSEEDSRNIEKEIIKKIGRYNLKKGPLTNLTDGGEGCSGIKKIGKPCTNQMKIDSSIRMKENNPMNNPEYIEKVRQSRLGKHHTEETKKKLAEISKGKKHTEETISILKEKRSKQIFSKETCDKIKLSNTGKNLGKKFYNDGIKDYFFLPNKEEQSFEEFLIKNNQYKKGRCKSIKKFM